jgi:anti-sigma regulatory factor (Ser/Thr protein kinase)
MERQCLRPWIQNRASFAFQQFQDHFGVLRLDPHFLQSCAEVLDKHVDVRMVETMTSGQRMGATDIFACIYSTAEEHGNKHNLPGTEVRHVRSSKEVRTGRAMVFYVRDPGAGFRRESLTHAAIANPADDPAAHIVQREAEGMRPGGYGLLLAGGTVDELIYNEIGNEVLLVKYVDSASAVIRA